MFGLTAGALQHLKREKLCMDTKDTGVFLPPNELTCACSTYMTPQHDMGKQDRHRDALQYDAFCEHESVKRHRWNSYSHCSGTSFALELLKLYSSFYKYLYIDNYIITSTRTKQKYLWNRHKFNETFKSKTFFYIFNLVYIDNLYGLHAFHSYTVINF